jgi:hypothetical protein
MNRRMFLGAIGAAGASALAFNTHASVLCSSLPRVHSFTQASGSSGKGLYMIWQKNLYAINPQTGEYRKLSDDNWAATSHITSLSGKIYAINGNILYMINPTDGSYKKLSSDSWIGTAYLSAGAGELFALSQGKFFRISPGDGSFKEIPTKFIDFISVKTLTWSSAAPAGKLFTICNTFCTIDTTTGVITSVKNDNWASTAPDLFVAMGNTIYAINGGTLYAINTSDGVYKKVSEDDWSSAQRLVALDGKLYLFADSAVYSIDATTGAFSNLGNRRIFKGAFGLTAVE